MKFSIASFVAAFGLPSLTSAITLSYDEGYDDPNRSLTVVACSDGPNGLISKYGWQTQGQIPNFAYIGGYQGIAGWNSPECGTCYSLTYAGTGKTITVLAIDHAGAGFNIALAAMNYLTNNQAVQLGRIDVNFVEVDISSCKVPSGGGNSPCKV